MQLKKRCLDPTETIRTLYEKGATEAVLHITSGWNDDNASGETEFTSGACWIANLSGLES